MSPTFFASGLTGASLSEYYHWLRARSWRQFAEFFHGVNLPRRSRLIPPEEASREEHDMSNLNCRVPNDDCPLLTHR